MTRFLALATLFSVFALSACKSALTRVTEEQVNLDYVGQIEVIGIERSNKQVLIDLSFSKGQWAQNSGRCFERLQSEIVDKQIIVQVYTSLCSGESRDPEIRLDSNLEGLYELVFRNPNGETHSLGTVTLPPKLNR